MALSFYHLEITDMCKCSPTDSSWKVEKQDLFDHDLWSHWVMLAEYSIPETAAVIEFAIQHEKTREDSALTHMQCSIPFCCHFQ